MKLKKDLEEMKRKSQEEIMKLRKDLEEKIKNIDSL